MTRPQGPVVVELDATDAPDPAAAPPVLDTPADTAVVAATRMAARRPSWFARLAWAAAGSLAALWLGTAVWDFVTGLLTRNVWLGRAALAAAAVLVLAVLLYVIRELASLARLGTLDGLRKETGDAAASGDADRARAVGARLVRFYAGRADLNWARADLARLDGDVVDGPERLALTERILMAPLDAEAAARIKAAARQVAAATAIIPLPLADVLAALVANLRMVRQVAEVYGGRAGGLGSWRLLRAVAVHLVATGAIGVADDMASSVIGGGAVARLSRRFGEGIVNGALTARVGLAAMELCRPMPFSALPRPGVTALMQGALAGVFTKGDRKD